MRDWLHVHLIELRPLSRSPSLSGAHMFEKIEWLPDEPSALHLREFLPPIKYRPGEHTQPIGAGIPDKPMRLKR